MDGGKVMGRMSINSYVQKNGYSLTRRQLMYWANKHSAARGRNDYETMDWIEDMLTEINYHRECTLFKKGWYDDAIGEEPRYHRNYGKEIEYRGLVFIPYGVFKDKKSSDYVTYDKAIQINGYSHEEFYRVVQSEADVFRIKGKPYLYVPDGYNFGVIEPQYVKCKIK